MSDNEGDYEVDKTVASDAEGDRSAVSEDDATRNMPSKRQRSNFLAGDLVADRYRIVRFIAAGGMGAVYEAEDIRLGGTVALKTISPRIAEEATSLDRFKREIQLARRISHPNICRIHDLGVDVGGEDGEEVNFLTMELLPGEELGHLIRREGPLDLDRVLAIVRQLCAGLDAAHQAGIIHRDFKSGNVMVARQGDPPRVVITDFGLARAVKKTPDMQTLSAAGMAIGTPAYMAPEQVEGLELTPAADLYALGIVMYEMVTGLRPFDGGSPFSVAARRLGEAPASPQAHRDDLPPLWEAVIMRCLARYPEDRFADAGAVFKALEGRLGIESSVPITPQPTTGDPSTVLSGGAALQGMAGREESRSLPWRPLLVIGLLALAAFGISQRWTGPSNEPAPAMPVAEEVVSVVEMRPGIAVLGLAEISEGGQERWIETAVAEMVGSELSAPGTLRVISRARVLQVARSLGVVDLASPTDQEVIALASTLSLDRVITGTYTLSGGGLLRIDLRLRNGADGEEIRSSGKTGSLEQIFELVDFALRPLFEELGIGILSASQSIAVKASLPNDTTAVRFYVEGIDAFNSGRILEARSAFEKAMEAEPGHPWIATRLASSLARLGQRDEARRLAETALTLDSEISELRRLELDAPLLLILERWPQAIEAFSRLFKQRPDEIDYGLALANAQIAAGRVREAMVTVEALSRLESAATDPRVDELWAQAASDLGQLELAIDKATAAAEKAALLGFRRDEAGALLLKWAALIDLGELDEALSSLTRARELASELGDDGLLAAVINSMAITSYYQGDFAGAERLYLRGIQLYVELGNELEAANLRVNVGNLRSEGGRYDEAIDLYDEALVVIEALGTPSEVAIVWSDIGSTRLVAGELDEALEAYGKALGIFQGIGDQASSATVLTNLGELQYMRGDLALAAQMHQDSLATNREIGQVSAAAWDLYRLGLVHAAKGDLVVARKSLEEAMGIQQELGEELNVAETSLGLARVALDEGEAQRAHELADEAEELSRAYGAYDLAARALLILAEAEIELGELVSASTAVDEARAAEVASPTIELEIDRVSLLIALAGGQGDVEVVLGVLTEGIERARSDGRNLDAMMATATLAHGRFERDEVAGREGLEALIAEAKILGLGTIVDRARQALSAAS